jgi:BTB And C-terminal Kelch/BTB/POZ domain
MPEELANEPLVQQQKSRVKRKLKKLKLDRLRGGEGDVEHSIEQICPDKYKNNWKIPFNLGSKSNIMELVLEKFQRSPGTTDICVHIGDEKFNCHMLILQSFSNFFTRKSRHERNITLNAENIDARSFCKIYKWMLSSSKKNIDSEDLIPLLICSEYLEIDLLTQQCWNVIQNGEWFQEDQAFLLYKEALKWNYEKIRLLMMKHVKNFFLTLVGSLDFLRMELEEVTSWLQLDTIGINSEVDVFYSACRWLLHNWDEREKHLMIVMRCVRFGLFAPWRIVELRKRNRFSEKLKCIMKSEELQKHLEASMSYAAYKRCFNDEYCEQFSDFLVRFKLERLFQRELIIDPLWQERYKNSIYTFDDFENYLEAIKANALKHWIKVEKIN